MIRVNFDIASFVVRRSPRHLPKLRGLGESSIRNLSVGQAAWTVKAGAAAQRHCRMKATTGFTHMAASPTLDHSRHGQRPPALDHLGGSSGRSRSTDIRWTVQPPEM